MTTATNYKDQASDFEALADLLELATSWRQPEDWPAYLEIHGPNHDGTYRGGETTRLRLVARGGDAEAGLKVIGMTGNEGVAYEITLSLGTPRGAISHLAEALLGELLDN